MKSVELPPGVSKEAISWSLHNSVDDPGYQPAKLTDAELEFCLEHEVRITGLNKLKREAKKRGFFIEGR
ncbi:hypothetical protein HSX37_16415|nr:hypothetical protein [Dendrosporobacter quercicolus]NSL49621.1 hypothetical protein [Dendrosporobacter quercicolus DSM 1736]